MIKPTGEALVIKENFQHDIPDCVEIQVNQGFATNEGYFPTTIKPNEEALSLAKRFDKYVTNCLGIQMNQDVAANAAYYPLLRHCINNLGDPFVGKGGHLTTFNYEKEAVLIMADYLNLPEHDAWGYFTPGSTFSNLHGVHMGMSRFSNEEPILVAAENALTAITEDYSIPKAAKIVRCKTFITIKVTKSGNMCPTDLLRKLLDRENRKNENFVFVFCSGSVAQGAYDDSSALLQSIKNDGVRAENYHLHLDATLGAMITPFLRGHPIPLDFSTEEISSLSVSTHKRMGTSIPASIFLARKQIANSLPKVDIDYVQSLDRGMFSH